MTPSLHRFDTCHAYNKTMQAHFNFFDFLYPIIRFPISFFSLSNEPNFWTSARLNTFSNTRFWNCVSKRKESLLYILSQWNQRVYLHTLFDSLFVGTLIFWSNAFKEFNFFCFECMLCNPYQKFWDTVHISTSGLLGSECSLPRRSNGGSETQALPIQTERTILSMRLGDVLAA